VSPASSLVVMEAQEPLDPARVDLFRSWGVMLCSAGPMDLLEQFHDCRMACEDTNVNMRRWKAG